MKTIAEIILAGERLATIEENLTVNWTADGRRKAGLDNANMIEKAIDPDGPVCLATGQVVYQCMVLKGDLEAFGNGVTLNLLVDINYGAESDLVLE